jgi:hypothetical protein
VAIKEPGPSTQAASGEAKVRCWVQDSAYGQRSIGVKHGTQNPTDATAAERRGGWQGQEKEEKLVLLRHMLNFFSQTFFLFPSCGSLIQENRLKKRLFVVFSLLASLPYPLRFSVISRAIHYWNDRIQSL